MKRFYLILAILLASSTTYIWGKPTTRNPVQSSSVNGNKSPCPAKHSECYQVPVQEQPGMQMMMIGRWMAGPKIGRKFRWNYKVHLLIMRICLFIEPIYSLEDLEENRRLLEAVRKNKKQMTVSRQQAD